MKRMPSITWKFSKRIPWIPDWKSPRSRMERPARCNQRHDCGTQGTQYGLNAFKTAVFIVKVRQCQTDDKGRYDTAQGTEDYAEGTGEPHADKG